LRLLIVLEPFWPREGHRGIFDVKGSINTSKEHTVAATKMELAELLSKAATADANWLREGVGVPAQALMDAEVSTLIGPSMAGAPRNG
jgi:hypothetical protein